MQALAIDKDDALSHRLLKLALDDALAFGGAAAVRVLMPTASPAGHMPAHHGALDLDDIDSDARAVAGHHGAASVPRAPSSLAAAVAAVGFGAGARAIDA